jgi:hypothetical protein
MPHVEKRLYWLWCCLGVLLAGCGQVFTTNVGRTPTLSLLNLPRSTLSPTAILNLIRTATPSDATSIHELDSKHEPIEVPTCYETAVGGMWCFGQVHNNRDGPLGGIVVAVYLIDGEGTELASRQVSMPRHLVPAGQFASYGVLFDNVPEKVVGNAAFIVKSTVDRDSTYNARVLAEDIRATAVEGTFHVNTRLVNHDDSTASDVSIFATTFNAKRQITGYRQQKLNEVTLEPGQIFPVSLDIVPIGKDSTRVEIAVEARRNNR